mmetsp:Transcript_58384/g.115917  ORF Transcript_58384/g.115917 Transcript_58384/m.115917 type:complete len:884 (-) Transcript_58384:598-3249(-)
MGCSSSKGGLSITQRDMLLMQFKQISAELSPDNMIAHTIDAILNLIPVERASVFLVDREAGTMRTFNQMDVQASRQTIAGLKLKEKVRSTGASVGEDGSVVLVRKVVTIPLSSGIAGSVAESGLAEIVSNAQTDTRFNKSIDEKTGFHTRNILSVPVKLGRHMAEVERQAALKRAKPGSALAKMLGDDGGGGGNNTEVVAVLQALNREGSFTNDDLVILEMFASLLSGVLARSNLIEVSVREKNKAEALLKVAETVSSRQNPRVKGRNIMTAVCLGVDCERSAFFLVDEVHKEQLLVSLNSDSAGLRLPLAAGLSGAVIQTGQPVKIADAYSDSRFNQEADMKTGYVTRDILAVPIIRPGSSPVQVIGVLEALNSKRHSFDGAHQKVLESIAMQVADRLMPELIQDMVETSVNDHGMEESEIERLRALLNAEYAPTVRKKGKTGEPPPKRVHEVFSEKSVNLNTISEDEDAAAEEDKEAKASTPKRAPIVHSATPPPPAGSATSFSTSARNWFGRSVLPGTAGEPLKAPAPNSPSGWFSQLPVLNETALYTAPRGWGLEKLISWDLDILALDSTELMQLAALIFKQSGVVDTFSIPSDTLAAFLSAIGARYHGNPYHNFNHGVHVLLCSWLLAKDLVDAPHTQSEGTHPVDPLSQLHILALLTGAVGHDVDHPGVNNAFLVNSNAPLALRYNDISVLENHHAATTFAILADKKTNILTNLTSKQKQEVRNLMISAILATDMAHHQAMVKNLTEQATGLEPVPINFTLKVVCHVADLGNCAISWPLSRVWAQRVCDEATAQAAREQQLGLPFGKLTPYTEEELVARQLVFLDGWVKPLYQAAAILFPSVRERLEAIQECREACKQGTIKRSFERATGINGATSA